MTDPTRAIDLTCDDVRELAAAFVLRALEPADDAGVRAHLASCSDAHAEIVEIGAVLPVFDASVPQVEPPAELKSRILAAAAADLEARRAAREVSPAAATLPGVKSEMPGRALESGTPPTPPVAPPPVSPSTVAFPSADERAARLARTSALALAMRIAAVLVIGVLAGWNLLLQGQLQSARTYEQNVAAVLGVAGKPGSLTAVLTPQDGNGPAGFAAVSADGKVSLAMRDLAPTTGDQVYEAWVIGADGLPVALGGFKVGSAGTAFFEGNGVPTQPGIVLALTKEPAPGATAPSSAPISLGTATAG